MSLSNLNPIFTPLLAAKLSVEMLMMVGLGTAALITLFTFSNWRMGVKVAFVVVLFEGALRKWVLPGAQELAYFAKDVFLIGAYMRFFISPDPELRAWRLRVPGGVLMILCMIVSFSALNPNIGSAVLALYGIKIYIFYLPLGFMVPFLFKSRAELESNIFWYAMLATPICLLGMAQYALPGDNFLNVTAHGGEGTSMGWEGAKIRVTGTFSYITGHTTFVLIFFSLHLALLMNKMPKWRFLCLLCNLPLLAGNALMSGSRSAVMLLAFSGGAFIVAGMFSKVGTAGSAVIKIGAIGVAAMLLMSLLFGEAREQWTARLQSSSDTVSTRVVGMPLKAIELAMQHGGLFGYGIGMTHPAVERMRSALKISRPRHTAPTYDVELGQVLVELGVVGWIAWYTLRILVLVLTFTALRSTEPGVLRSLVVASITIQIPQMLLGMVLNHTANFLVFGFFGIAMIPLLSRVVQRRVKPGAAPLAAVPAVPSPIPVLGGPKCSQSRSSR